MNHLNEVSKRKQRESNEVQGSNLHYGRDEHPDPTDEFAGIRYQTNKEPENNKTRGTSMERKKITRDDYPQQKTIF